MNPRDYFRIVFLTYFFLILGSSISMAGDKPFKLGKDIFYVGNVAKKTPQGKGELYLQLNKDLRAISIKGTFNGNTITNGSYSNIIKDIKWKNSRSVTGMTPVFSFDSLRYTINKKEKSLTVRAWGIEFSNSANLLSPAYIDIKYVLNTAYEIESLSNHLNVKVFGRNMSDGKYTYDCFVDLERQRKVHGGNSKSFEPMYYSSMELKDQTNPVIIRFENGAVTNYKKINQGYGNENNVFTTKYGNNIISGEVNNSGDFRYTQITVYNDLYSANVNNIYKTELRGRVSFSNGSKYYGCFSTESLQPQNFGTNILTSKTGSYPFRYIVGTFITSDNFGINYRDNKAEKSDLFGHKIKAYEVKCPGYAEAPYFTHRNALDSIVENDRTTLRDLVNRGDNHYGKFCKKDLENLFNDEYFYHEPVSFSYNTASSTISFKGYGQEIHPHSDSKMFYTAVESDGKLCLSYPKSRISLHHGKNYFNQKRTWPTLETAKISKETYDKISNRKTDLVWVFKIDKFEHYEVMGSPKRLYIIDHDTFEILADISESLNSGNSSFKKETREVYKKKTYHERGRIENCGICLGTGMGWQGGICPFCGGKGWYIEHEW